eukprot:4736733-Amphidinium_carterae.2
MEQDEDDIDDAEEGDGAAIRMMELIDEDPDLDTLDDDIDYRWPTCCIATQVWKQTLHSMNLKQHRLILKALAKVSAKQVVQLGVTPSV